MADKLNVEIRDILTRIKANPTRVKEADLLELCRLGVKHQIPADTIGEKLWNFDVKESIVCDFTTVLFCEPARARVNDNKITWRAVLDVAWKEIAQEIRAILADPKMGESMANEGRYWRLCFLAHQWGCDPETFRRLLIREGLEDSRASEVKVVLTRREVCQRFLDEKDPLGWEAAKGLARQAQGKEEGKPEYPTKQAARKVIGLVVQNDWPKSSDPQKKGVTLLVERHATGKYIITHGKSGTWFLEPVIASPSINNENNNNKNSDNNNNKNNTNEQK